jgi:hypothetical protein
MDCLVALPFDLKVLQEAVANEDLERSAREIAAGAIVHALLPQEGEGPLRYADDVLFVRAALRAVVVSGGEAASAYRERFSDIYGALDEQIAVLEAQLGPDAWSWIVSKLTVFPRTQYKGKRAAQYVDDEESHSLLYEEGLEFQTNYNVTEEQIRNRLRRADQVTEYVAKRKSDDARRSG